jgi:hypothetical protein
LLVFAIVLSMTISLTFTATPVLAEQLISQPGGTTITVQQGQEFVLSFRMAYDEPVDGRFAITLKWVSPDNNPAENFTIVGVSAYFDNGQPIVAAVTSETEAPYDNIGTLYVRVIGTPVGEPNDGPFNVDVTVLAGSEGVAHIPGIHTIEIDGSILVAEELPWLEYFPPDPVITIEVTPWVGGYVVRGKENTYTLNLEGLLPFVYYNTGDYPPIMAAERIGTGAVVAAGLAATTRDGRWNDTDPLNPAPYLPNLFDAAFQWMNPGAVNVLWYENNVYNNTARTSDLIAALTGLGYTIENTSVPIDTPGVLDGVDILVWPQVQLEFGDRYEGGDPDKLPDSWVTAVADFVNAGGGVLVLEGSDFGAHNYARVTNKLLEGLGFDWRFQHDAVYGYAPDVWGASWETMAEVDTTTVIGSSYLAATGTSDIGVYSTNSLSLIPTFGVNVSMEPAENIGAPEEEVTFVATVTNTGDAWDTYTLNLTDTLGWPELTFLPKILSTTLGPDSGDEVGVSVYEGTPDNVFVPEDDYKIYVGADAGGRYRIFVRFDLSAIPGEILSAELEYRTRVVYENQWVSVRSVDNDVWPENANTYLLTWNNQPATVATLDTVFIGSDEAYTYFTSDVTSFVASEWLGDQVASFALVSENEDTVLNPVQFYDYRFSLIVTYFTLVTTKTVDVGPGASETVDLSVIIDPDAIFSTRDTLTVTATSRYDPTVVASGSAKAHAKPPVVRGVLVEIIPTEQTGWSALTYTVKVTNAGWLDDMYELTVEDTEGWGLEIDPSQLWIAAGDSDYASLSVSIPRDAIGGTVDNITVWARGTMSSGTGEDLENAEGYGGAKAIAEVVRGVDVDVLPSQSQTGAPEDNLVWVVKVRNIGNVPDNYTLDVTENVRDGERVYPDWGATLEDSTFELAAGEIKSTKLSVIVPTGARTSIWNTLTVTATSDIDPGISDSEARDAHVLEPGPLIPQGTIELLVEAEIIAIDLWPTSWDFGILDETEDNETTDNYFTLRNVGNEPVNITITGSDAQSRPGEPVTTWRLKDTMGTDEYAMKFENAAGVWTVLKTTPSLGWPGVQPGEEYDFDLWIQAPSVITVPAKMWTIVTLTAVEA